MGRCAVRSLRGGLVDRSRIVMEKAVRHHLESARSLNANLHESCRGTDFSDHHFSARTGAEHSRFRFANGLFEPIWNRKLHRPRADRRPGDAGSWYPGTFYEANGAFPTWCDPPLPISRSWRWSHPRSSHRPSAKRRTRFFEACSIDPQRSSAASTTDTLPRRRHPESETETFIALKCSIDNCVGPVCRFPPNRKAACRGQRSFRSHFVSPQEHVPCRFSVGAQGPDHLTFDLADASKMSLSFYGKRPGPGMRLDKTEFAIRDADTALSATSSRPMSA